MESVNPHTRTRTKNQKILRRRSRSSPLTTKLWCGGSFGVGVKREEIKNLKKAAGRILKAIKNKEKIILYGDADLDGTVSVIILKETIKNLGGQVAVVYFPDREEEGYGINKEALDYLKDYAPALFVVLDCGIGNFAEVKLAKKIGFEIIIIDHHEILGKLPSASIIIDPKQKGDNYPFKDFAAAGLTYKLSQILFGKKMTDALNNDFLELAALATIADMMPRVGENKDLIKKGLSTLENTFRPGLRVFRHIYEDGSFLSQIVPKIISVLNIGNNQNHLTQSYLLLTASDEKAAKKMALGLLEKGEERKQRIREITGEAEERVANKLEDPIFFEGDNSWSLIFLGSIASRICNRYKKPVFLFRKGEKESPGTVRTPPGIDGVKAMIACSKFLETYGGHPQAGGFRVKNENLGKFKKCLIKYFKPRYS